MSSQSRPHRRRSIRRSDASPAPEVAEHSPTPAKKSADAGPAAAPARDEKVPLRFADLGVCAEICRALREQGVDRTFAIQELTLPIALDGRDLIGQARTGMGKTFGFGVPLVERVFDDADIDELDGTPRALVIVPTRELAVQVGEDLHTVARYTPVKVATVYGGTSIENQIAVLKKGVDVVVGTPGRVIDLFQRHALQLDQVAILVLDEADEMLDLGFFPDIEKLLRALTHKRQTMLFSATLPGPVLQLARGFMVNPIHIRAEEPDAGQTHATTTQVVFQSHRMDKPATVAKILQAKNRGKTMIFTRTKRNAASVAEDLAERGFKVAGIHGDLNQQAREVSLNAFRTGQVDILVSTDVAARGIDIDDVTHVINFQTPDDPMTYVHRIGRTGRAGHSGTAITLVGYDELHKWKIIDEELDFHNPEPPQWFSTSPELHEALSIPAGVKDRVGPALKVFGSHLTKPQRPAVRRPSTGSRRGRRS